MLLEIEIDGFDGGTDKTDHLILWVECQNEKDIKMLRDNPQIQGIQYINHLKSKHHIIPDLVLPKDYHELQRILENESNAER